MPETFSTRQAAVIASATKIIFWQFKITDNLDNEHYWSTGTCPSVGTETINSGATEAPGAYTSGEWNRAHTFKIVNFSGVTLRRNKTESGIHAPNDVNFTIVNSSNAYTASNFVGGAVRIGLVIDDGNGRELCGSWRFVIKSASPYNQQIDVVCEDFLQQYLKGSYPNTQLINEIFPNTYDANKTGDSICVPEPYGTCYIPLRPVYATDGRYYLLGDTTNTYTITKVRSPRSLGTKVEWDSGSFAFTQSTKADAGANNWRVFQPIIADSNLDGTVDANGVWLNGSGLVDMPVKFSRSDTASITSPADIIRYVLRNMGILDYDLDLASFDTAKTTYTSWGLTWNFAFWYKQDRKKVLANLLAMCHSCLIVGEKIRLQVLSKTSQSTIDETNVLASSETGPPQFQYTDSLAEVNSDSGYVAWQQTGESQDEFLRALVPAKSATDVIDQEVLQVSAVQDSQQIQKLGTLYYQRKFLKSADISTSVKGLILAIRPDDVATVDNSDYFGGTYNVLVDEVSITPDAAVKLRCIKFSETLDDWEDLAPSAITVGTDAPSSPGSYSPVIAGPDAPGATNLPNALPGRLRVGQTTNYILLEPLVSSTRISLYSADIERMRFGNLNGYLDYVTNLYGIAVGDASNYLKYDPTNGLRISGAISAGTIDIGGSDATSFHVDANGNMWLGAATFDIATNPFAVSNAGVLRAVSGTIGGTTLSATALTGGIIQTATSGARVVLNSSGIAIYDATTQRAKIGADGAGWFGASDKFYWDSTGNVIFAGFGATNAALSVASGGNTTTISSTGTNAFIAGPTGAPTVSISHAGVLTATGASISGAITATSGTFTGTINATAGYFGDGATRVAIEAGGLNIGNTGSIRGGQTAYNTGTGFFLGYSGGAYKYSIGNPAGNYLTWDGSALTYTKGTLVETIIQMYTNVASLKTSATAGDGSVNSAGMVLTYEGLFGCGASQTATVAAANANVRILADGSAYFKGVITADTGYIGGTSGWVIAAGKITSTGIGVATAAGDATYAFWAGDDTPASAEFSVTHAGALVATSATITGTVVDAITLGHSSNILLAQGGSIKFTSVSSPTACTASLVTTGTGNVTDGSHEYSITFVTATGETSLGTISNSVTVDASHKQVNLTNIPLSSSPAVTARKIYRNLAGGAIHFYLATISDNTTTIYTDNIADGSLGTYSWDSRQNDTFGKIINDSIEILSVGSTNTLVGYNTARSVNLGKNITFIGADAGYTNTTGGASVAVGTNALYLNSSGAYNTCVGFSSLYKTTAGGNVGVGAYAGWAITTGTNNVFLGYGAGQNSQLATATNSIAIGYNTQTTASNQIALGNTSTTETILQGNILVGITAVGTSSVKVLGIGNGTAPTTAPANVGQLWCEDINGAAGYAGLHMMVETNAVKLVVPGVYIKGTTGQIANPFEGLLEINTFDNTVKMYADAGWRTLASGW